MRKRKTRMKRRRSGTKMMLGVVLRVLQTNLSHLAISDILLHRHICQQEYHHG